MHLILNLHNLWLSINLKFPLVFKLFLIIEKFSSLNQDQHITKNLKQFYTLKRDSSTENLKSFRFEFFVLKLYVVMFKKVVNIFKDKVFGL